MTAFRNLSERLEEALAAPVSVIGGPSQRYAAPNAADVDLANTRDYSELLGTSADHSEQDEDDDDDRLIDVDESEAIENEDETNWVSDQLDESGMSVTGIGNIIAALVGAPGLAKRVEAAVKQTGVKSPDEVAELSNAFREALVVHLASVVPLAMRDVGIDVGQTKLAKAEKQAKKQVKGGVAESKSHERTLDRLAREIEEWVSR